MQILVIEDNPTFSQLIKNFLADINYEVDVVHSLISGKVMLDNLKYNLVILDLNLPNGQGIDTFNDVFSSYPGMPILVLTACNDPEVIQTVRDSGCEFIAKGSEFDYRLFMRIVKHIMEINYA